MSKNDNKLLGFGLGLLGGVVAGVIGAILYAPRSGRETRHILCNKVNEIAQKHGPDILKAKQQAFESIDLMRYKLERQYNKINEMIKAKQLAKAKELESSCDCDFE